MDQEYISSMTLKELKAITFGEDRVVEKTATFMVTIYATGAENIARTAREISEAPWAWSSHVEGCIRLSETGSNNHGCSGEHVVIFPTSDTEGIVVNGGSCSSCWQTGCDDSNSPIEIGSLVQLPESFRDNVDIWPIDGEPTYRDCHRNEGEWISNEKPVPAVSLPVIWQHADRWVGFSHNELVDDLDDAQPDTTLVRPADLIVS